MNPRRLPVATGRDVTRALKKAGFEVVRQKGSHVRLVHAEDATRKTTVPQHGSNPLKIGTLDGILEQAGLSPEEFTALL
ncbi:type II toxin-antitoxin system HicA family toxin [Fulvimarina sp. 2208YS6-2-32]|uniref:type II toxin-antitoxin system HicA family toxin n=1 Tax=Fulvimarina uroteuthidis TaxID=3098149 RepID=UPI003A103A16